MAVTARLIYGSKINMTTQGTAEKIAAASRRIGWEQEVVELYELAEKLGLTDCAINSWEGDARVVGALLATGVDGYGEVMRTEPTEAEVAAVESLRRALELTPPTLCLVATRA